MLIQSNAIIGDTSNSTEYIHDTNIRDVLYVCLSIAIIAIIYAIYKKRTSIKPEQKRENTIMKPIIEVPLYHPKEVPFNSIPNPNKEPEDDQMKTTNKLKEAKTFEFSGFGHIQTTYIEIEGQIYNQISVIRNKYVSYDLNIKNVRENLTKLRKNEKDYHYFKIENDDDQLMSNIKDIMYKIDNMIDQLKLEDNKITAEDIEHEYIENKMDKNGHVYISDFLRIIEAINEGSISEFSINENKLEMKEIIKKEIEIIKKAITFSNFTQICIFNDKTILLDNGASEYKFTTDKNNFDKLMRDLDKLIIEDNLKKRTDKKKKHYDPEDKDKETKKKTYYNILIDKNNLSKLRKNKKTYHKLIMDEHDDILLQNIQLILNCTKNAIGINGKKSINDQDANKLNDTQKEYLSDCLRIMEVINDNQCEWVKDL